MLISAKSDKGKVREENQDSYSSGQLEDGAFAVVCDGMGGAAGGSIASGIAVEAFTSALDRLYSSSKSVKSLKSMMTVASDKANSAVYERALDEPELQGMGTTIVAAIVNDDKVSLIHAGDSRAYLYSGGTLTQLTHDHSMVQALVDDGYISEEQAEHHMYKNIITRALGTDEQVKVDFYEYEICESDILILCSDGLTNYVTRQKMSEILSQEDLDSAVNELVDCANGNGGGDNITVVAIKR